MPFVNGEEAKLIFVQLTSLGSQEKTELNNWFINWMKS